MFARFADRRAAGRALGERLRSDRGEGEQDGGDVVVLGLPRGGVVVAAEVATALGAPLDVVLVRKLGLPGQPELAMGAIAAAGPEVETVRNEHVLATSPVDADSFARVHAEELWELRRRERTYRAGRAPLVLDGRDVVLVDDGLATGSTMRAAVAAVRRSAPASLTVAVPIGSPRVCRELAAEVDRVVCLEAPASFRAVGQGFRRFAPTTDDEVVDALAAARSAGDPPEEIVT